MFTVRVQSQELSPNDSLRIWSDILFSSNLEETRFIASRNVENLIYRLLELKTLDSSKLNNNIIRLKVPDKEIEIFTWQSEKATKDFDYHCLIKNEDGSLLKFTRENRDYSRIRREEFNKDNWYGAVYYHILPQSFGNQNYYILFGFAQNSSEEKFKIIETISFNTNDLKLGLPVFPYVDKDKESTTLNRMLIKYSQGSNCLLRFEEVEKQIIFDHMIYYEDFGSGTMGSYLPDGSYEAFEYKGKTWKYIPKLKVEVQSTPPRERPVLDGNTKDIFGKDKKK